MSSNSGVTTLEGEHKNPLTSRGWMKPFQSLSQNENGVFKFVFLVSITDVEERRLGVMTSCNSYRLMFAKGHIYADYNNSRSRYDYQNNALRMSTIEQYNAGGVSTSELD